MERRSRSDLEWLDGWVPPEWIYAEPDEEAGLIWRVWDNGCWMVTVLVMALKKEVNLNGFSL